MAETPFQPRRGGSYRADKAGGERVRVAGTEEHRDGNRRRDAAGRPLRHPVPAPAPAAIPPVRPAAKPKE
ncbi:MAG: hypothetical protein AB7N54_20220 [Alphaproteobacteria bacterium]